MIVVVVEDEGSGSLVSGCRWEVVRIWYIVENKIKASLGISTS